MTARPHWPSIDGIRGIAIAAVVAFHLGYLPGGWLGVDVFFVLSGFLITGLLLDEQAGTGRVDLLAFWGRRARRLLPALLLLLAVLAVYAWWGGPGVVPAQVRDPALATLLYVANWQQLLAGHDYFAHYQATSPLLHTWSLAVEEQYYLLWPLLLGGLALLVGRRRSGPSSASPVPTASVVVVSVLTVASALWMGIAAHTLGVERAYLGTDTRAWELLAGSLAAMALRRAGPARTGARWTVVTVVAAAGVGVGVAFGGGPPGWMWDGGLVVVAACAAAIVAGVVRSPATPVARLLALAPLRGLGLVSYSLYLWHWPVIVLMTPATTGLAGGVLLACRLATMVGASCLSYVAVERPLRRLDWRRWRRALAPAGVFGVAVVVLAGTASPVEASTATVPRQTAVSDGVGAPIVLPPGRVPSPTDPLRVWILGDSVMADSAPGVTAALQATGDVTVVADSAFGGWGLSTDHGWTAQSTQIIDRYHPEVVLGTWSWDDPAAAQRPQAYLGELVGAVGHLLAPGTGVDDVVLLQFPQVGPNPYYIEPSRQLAEWRTQNAEQIAWNDDARLAARLYAGHAAFLSTQQLFAPGDRYVAWNRTPSGAWLRTRKIDNTHVCPYGAAELGALVVGDLAPALGLGPMARGWQSGAWVHDANFNDPPGACPDDQPPPRYAGVAVPGPAS